MRFTNTLASAMAAVLGIMITTLPAAAYAASTEEVVISTMAEAPADVASATVSPSPQKTPSTNAPIRACETDECNVKVSATFVVQRAEQLIVAGQYDKAQPWLDMLAIAPDHQLEYHFLSGLMALGKEDYAGAERHYRAILDQDPSQTRVRLDLSYALMKQGKTEAADYHLRLAEQSGELPDDLRTTVRTARSAIRDSKSYRFGFNIGVAPDTNINNATNAETVDINLGPFALPLTLNDDARSQSGIGITANLNAAVRLPVADTFNLLMEADGNTVNYKGSAADDYQMQVAVGPEFQLGENMRATVQFVGTQRWYGGEKLARNYGVRGDIQFDLGDGSALAVRGDAQRSEFFESDGYDGWSYGTTISYERGVYKSFSLSTTAFVRRNDFVGPANANWSGGVVVGVGGELPAGFNIGASAVISYAKFDQPDYLFSFDRREDVRFGGRAVIGNRSLRVLGFSPSLEYNYTRNESNYILYDTDRHRVEFKLARYF
jgi:outer membrane protein